MMGKSATVHISTENAMTTFGTVTYAYHIEANYDVPPVSMTLTGAGESIETACGQIAWQFLEQIGMPSE